MTADLTSRPRRRPISGDAARFDRQVDAWFAQHLRGRPIADRIFYGASALGDHGTIWLILAVIRGLRSDEDLPAAMRAAAGVGVESALVNGPIKWMFRRPRPVLVGDRPLPLRRPRTSSFPSGHATSAFCAAALLSDGDEAWAALYYGLAVVVAWSRVHVGIHHASDVIAGMAIGAVLGELGTRIVRLPRPAPMPLESDGGWAR